MKAVLLSIRPKWCGLIASGKKTIEVRKTRPKLETPFKCYIYQSKAHLPGHMALGGTPADPCSVIGEFICDWIMYMHISYDDPNDDSAMRVDPSTGMTAQEEMAYLGNPGDGWYWHISSLDIYETPRPLLEFRKVCPEDLFCESCGMHSEYTETCGNAALYLRRPPQSWCYVEEVDGRARI